MNIEETHPSLKMLSINGESKYMDNCGDEDFYKEEDVQEHTIDKQKVREAIEIIRKKYHMKALDAQTVCDDIEKELNL